MFKKTMICVIVLCLFSVDSYAKSKRDPIVIEVTNVKINYSKCSKMENVAFLSMFRDCINTVHGSNSLTIGECNLFSRKVSNSFYYNCVMGKL